MKYGEIKELYGYCKRLDIPCEYIDHFDGHAIMFNNGGDVAQCKTTRGAKRGCVEFAIEKVKIDYKAIPLERAKEIVKKYRYVL